MIIFFDYPDDGLDGSPDHTAIVEKVEGGRVYTVEGNYSDMVGTDDYAMLCHIRISSATEYRSIKISVTFFRVALVLFIDD